MQRQNKASHNLIAVNAFQFAALLERNFSEVLVAGAESPAVEMAARMVATLMRDFNSAWALQRTGDDPLPPVTFHFNSKNIVPLCREYVNSDGDDYNTVRAVPLRELDVPRSGNVAAVMLVRTPNCYGGATKYMFELFTQIDGFIYSTGAAVDVAEKEGVRLFNTGIPRHDIGRLLAQPLPVTEPRNSLDIWFDVTYGLLSAHQKFHNEQLGKDVAVLEEVEDFRTGIERATVLEINQFPPKALASLEAHRGLLPREDRKGSDADVALVSLKSVGDLSFFPIPKQYTDSPLRTVRVAEDPEVAGDFVVYLAFTMPSGGFEEQVVISGRNFKAIYSAANQLADATMTSIHYSVDVDKHFEQ